MAKQRVTDAGMGCEISIRKDMQDADLNRADVILSMLPESGDDYDELFKNEVRPGTRLIKHDLPLLGFDYTDVDYPFYLIRFPLRRIKSPLDWASRVIGRRVGSLQELWHELFYYQEKGYTKWDIRQFERVLLLRQEAFSKARHKTEVRIAPTFTRG